MENMLSREPGSRETRFENAAGRKASAISAKGIRRYEKKNLQDFRLSFWPLISGCILEEGYGIPKEKENDDLQ